VTGVKTRSGKDLVLGEDADDVTKRFSKGKETVAAAGTGLKRLRFDTEGVELLVKDEVLAISLLGPNAPSLPLRGRSPAGGTAGTLKVGMPVAEAEKILGDDYTPCSITAADVTYRFYRLAGVALRVVGGEVAEVVIVQMPG
jgi:hypothetical protein